MKAAYRLLEARYLFWSIRLGDPRIGMIVHSSLAIAGSCRSVLQYSPAGGACLVEQPIIGYGE